MIGHAGCAKRASRERSTQSMDRASKSLGLAYQAAIEGVGVAMGVGCLVADDLAAGRLARPLSFSYRSKWTFNLFYPSARATEPRLAALCSFLMSESEVAMLQGSADLTRGRKVPSTRRG